MDNLLIDDNLESFDILEEVGGSLLENVERYALYVAQVLQDEGMDFVANRTGDNIGMSYTLSRYTVRLSMTCVCVCVCVQFFVLRMWSWMKLKSMYSPERWR